MVAIIFCFCNSEVCQGHHTMLNTGKTIDYALKKPNEKKLMGISDAFSMSIKSFIHSN